MVRQHTKLEPHRSGLAQPRATRDGAQRPWGRRRAPQASRRRRPHGRASPERSAKTNATDNFFDKHRPPPLLQVHARILAVSSLFLYRSLDRSAGRETGFLIEQRLENDAGVPSLFQRVIIFRRQ